VTGQLTICALAQIVHSCVFDFFPLLGSCSHEFLTSFQDRDFEAFCEIGTFSLRPSDNLPVDRRGGAPPSSTDFPTDDRSIFEIGKSPMLTCGTDTNVGTGPSALENVKMRSIWV
jgi:hypothetical protein